MAHLLWCTYSGEPDIQSDDAPAVAAFEARGVRVEPYPWDRPHRSVGPGDLLLLRSAWNYHQHSEAFEAWLEAVDKSGCNVLNPIDLLRWNLRKTYLVELAKRGVNIPPTLHLRAGSLSAHEAALSDWEATTWVAKPVISMSAWQTERLPPDSGRRTRLAELNREQDLLLQGYVSGVEQGELSLVYFDRTYSHAVLKIPRPGDFRVQADFGGRRERVTPPLAALTAADAIVARLPGPLPYVRIDGVMDGDSFVLMEVEAIDPMLFFGFAPETAPDFVDAVLRAGGM
jgi:glutathione synthase/RimK-type ligase-like ATP-grasp enzyme